MAGSTCGVDFSTVPTPPLELGPAAVSCTLLARVIRELRVAVVSSCEPDCLGKQAAPVWGLNWVGGLLSLWAGAVNSLVFGYDLRCKVAVDATWVGAAGRPLIAEGVLPI